MDGKVIPVKVAVRCRPLVEKELTEGCQTCLQFMPGERQIVIGKDKAFTFDFVFEPTSEQERVYQDAVVPLVRGLFKGFNATVLAYGQTGSGKTFTMGGGYGVSLDTNEEIVGVIPRVIRDLFSGINERTETFEFTVKVSYLEIYKEDLMDLFVPPAKRDKDQITIRDDVSGGIKLAGMTEVEVRSLEETMKLLEEGSQGRTTGSTAMNNSSSRSHAIFTIYLDRKNKKDSHDFCKAKFHLVDLAGSERVKKTHAEGERLREGININKGLLSLGNVISALGDEMVKHGHIPYRDSKLTRLLQDSLGGNSHTVMIACISPADSNMEETISTLRYADRARKIKNKPVVNRDPQAAEILRLRQMVQELQSQGLVLGKPLLGVGDLSNGSETVDYKSLMERCKKLEEEKHKLALELQASVGQNTDMMEKIVRLEISRDRLKAQMQDLKQKTGLSITQLMNTTKPDMDEIETQTSRVEVFEQHLSVMREFQDKIQEIETEDVEQVDGSLDEEDAANVTDSADTEEMRNEHVLQQAKLGRQLQELNNMLQKKQELASQMLQNDEQLLEMRQQYERQMKDMELEIEKLQKEKEDISHVLQSVKANAINNKIAEQRRKRMQELELQIGQLKKKMTEQSRMLKIKEQADKQVEKLNQEIVAMKQQRVKLINQIKGDAEQFRKKKAEMAKELLQLKSKDRKREAVIAKLQREKVNQQAVLRRKAEEASAVANRLKDVLMRQKLVVEDRSKKQQVANMSGIGARVRKILGDEFDFTVSVEEAKLHLERQMALRKDLVEQLHQLRERLEGGPANENSSMKLVEITDDVKEVLSKQMKELDQQVDLCNVQITDLQQKLMDADQDEKCKSRWDNIHTMVEAKCAMKWLLNMAVTSKVESDKKDSDIEDIKANLEESSKALEVAEEELRVVQQAFEKELHAVRKEQETKILYLLNQLRNTKNGKSNEIPDEELRKRIAFQEVEIARLAHLEEELANRTKECDQLRKELTKAQYNSTLNRDGSLMPADVGSHGDVSKATSDCDPEKDLKFFSPAFFTKQSRKRTMGPIKQPLLKGSDESSDMDDEGNKSENEDLSQDPDWEKGLTPGFGLPKQKSRTRMSDGCCRCKTSKCIKKSCACYKMARACTDACGCKSSGKCQNTLPSNPLLAVDTNRLSDESSMNRTFTCDASQSLKAGRNDDPSIIDPNQITGTRKRSSGSKKKTGTSGKEAAIALSEDQNHELLSEGLNGLEKKRKLQSMSGSRYFVDDPVA